MTADGGHLHWPVNTYCSFAYVQRQATRDAALKTVKELCAAHEFTASDLKGSIKVSRGTRTKTVAKSNLL